MVFFPSYVTCLPSQYLAITGYGIPGTLITKKKWILPGQRYRILDVSPQNYEFDIHAMSKEMLPFSLPAVFTIGPNLEIEELNLYAQLLATHDLRGEHVHVIIKGIVEGETRVLAASLTMKEIFEGTKEFKQLVFEKVQLELNQFGLKIYNANIKQLSDLPGHEYFSYLGQKIQKGAANQAKIDIAHANYLGDVGAKEKEGETLRNICKVQNETKLFELEQTTVTEKQIAERQAEVNIRKNQAAASVAINKAKLDQDTKIAAIEAQKNAQIREAELEKHLNERQAIAATEKFRAEQYSKAVVENEIVAKNADASFYKSQRESDALFYQNQRELDAFLLKKQREAEAISLIAVANANAVEGMIKAFGGDVKSYLNWKMLDDSVFERLATCNANAVQGLKPSVSIWNTGSQTKDASSTITDLFQSIPPIFSTIEKQTGMQILPSLIAQKSEPASS